MNCERIENLLSAYVDGDVTADERGAVDAHVAACESCRESLAVYRELEGALVMRRDLVPPAGPFLREALHPAVPSNLHRARVLMDRLFSFPALASFFFVVLAWAVYSYSGPIANALNWLVGETPAANSVGGWLTTTLTALTRGDMLITAAAYGVLTLLILGSGTWMTLRYVHSE